MRHLTITFWGIILFACMNCYGQTASADKSIPLSDVKFKFIFGRITTDSSQVYCLLGTDFFKTPRSKNADSLITVWLTQHPHSIVIPVSTHHQVNPEKANEKLTYCWVVDNTDTLNLFLIKHGAFPSRTMQRPNTWEEMSEKEKQHYLGIPKADIHVYIDKKDYSIFIKKVKKAESFARANKLGIWKNRK